VTGLGGDRIDFDFVFSGDFAKPQEANEFFLWGKLAGLDSEREWFYDEATKDLYLHAPGG